MSLDKCAFKSRYRGVYRCGKRWKAQLQSHGIQFYLGIFDTEEDAARAYDRKAREEKGGKNPMNFEVTSGDSENFQLRPASPSYRYYGGGEEDDDIQFSRQLKYGLNQNKRARTDENQNTSENLKRLDYQATTENMKILWDRHCQIAQRLLLAKAAQSKLAEFQAVAPDTEKETILKALSEEIVLLVVVKSQLEEAVSRCFRMGLDLNTSAVPPPPPNDSASHPVPLHQQDRRNGEATVNSNPLPPFGSNFNSNSSGTMPPYCFPQLPPFPSAAAQGAGADPFAPLRKPYLPIVAQNGSYFGQTLPPSALPSLSLPRSVAPLPVAPSPAAVPAVSSSSTQKSAGDSGTAAVDISSSMSSFHALTKGPSLLGNTHLLTAPALMDNVLVGNSRLPPLPQLPLTSAGFEPPLHLSSVSTRDLSPVSSRETVAVSGNHGSQSLPLAAASVPTVTPAQSQSSIANAVIKEEPKTAHSKSATAAAALKTTHKVVQPPQAAGTTDATKMSSGKRSTAVAAESSRTAVEVQEAHTKDSPKKIKASASSAPSSTTGKASFPGSDHVLFQLSAEQEKAIISAAVAASKSRNGRVAAPAQQESSESVFSRRPAATTSTTDVKTADNSARRSTRR